METGNTDYLLRVFVPEPLLCEGKNPPLCDACATPFGKVEEREGFDVAALVLVDSESGEGSIWGLVCPKCVSAYHGALAVKTEREEPMAARALRGVLGRPLTLGFFETDEEFYAALSGGVMK